MAKRRRRTTNVADQIAEFIGRSMGELLNRKESLQRQLAEVESQIVEVGQRVNRQFNQFATKGQKRRGRRTGVKGVADQAVVQARKAKRAVSPETRRKMAEAARKRWAAIKKAAKE
jgi:hypothetical protein